MRGKTRIIINEKTVIGRVTACNWARMLQKCSDEGRHGLPEATKTPLVTGDHRTFFMGISWWKSQLSVILFQTLKEASQIVWKRASRVFLSEGYKAFYWEKEALVHNQHVANAFTYLSLCCTPPHPSPPAQAPFSHAQDGDLHSRLTLWLNEHLLSNRYWRHLFLFLQLRSGLSEQFLLHLKEKNPDSSCFKFFPFFISSIKGKKNKNKTNNGIGPPCGLWKSTPNSALKTWEITN